MTQKTFISSDGKLCLLASPGPVVTIREDYARTYSTITTGRQLRATLRAGAFAWPGGYPLYFITSDGAALSFESVKKELRSVIDSIRTRCNDGWRVIGCEINYEEPDLRCAHSGKSIDAAYVDGKSDL